jgi:hypothetical protein
MFMPEPNSGCWIWLGPIFEKRGGYGCFTMRPAGIIMQRAHRVSWKLYRRADLPKEVHILHHCDNVLCVNPDHLFEGDQAANMRDKSLKGRQLRGKNHPKYKHGLYVGDKANPEYTQPRDR